MRFMNPGRVFGAIVTAVAVLNTISALSMPVQDRRLEPPQVLVGLAVLLAHAALYLAGDRVRARWSLRAYTAAQATVLFLIALSGAPAPVTIGLFMAATAELVVLAESRWMMGTVRITLGAIALYVLPALITSDVYRATTAGLLLAVTGLVAHAVAALVRRPAVQMPPPVPLPVEPAPVMAPDAPLNGAMRLSARETEVLRELVTGARNSDIAIRLGISERTVKTHLGSIYQKLGVETRAAAVAAAVQRKFV
jgi:DNA-binding CsgD family transcriptional regulator